MQILATRLVTRAIHYTARFPPIMYNSACYNSRPLTGKNKPSQMGVVLIHKNGSQSIGAGVYHPQFNKITIANPGGTSINKVINRAELAGTAAALINENTHIATDSAGALWQIRNSTQPPAREMA